jgi:uncharacterized protein (TIGR02266 family)
MSRMIDDPADDLEIDVDVDQPGSAPRGVERRATPRFRMRLGVRFNSPGELARAVRATTRDIGLGGLCLRTRKAYQPGSDLELVIELGGGESLSLSAVVAWAKPGAAIGLRFAELDDEQKSRLAQLIGQRKPEGPDIDLDL